MVHFLAVAARSHSPFPLIGNIYLVKGRIDHIPQAIRALLVPTEHSIIGKPAVTPKHVGEHVTYPFRVDLGHYSHISGE